MGGGQEGSKGGRGERGREEGGRGEGGIEDEGGDRRKGNRRRGGRGKGGGVRAEVDEFDVSVLSVRGEQQVLRLNIRMAQPLGGREGGR